MDVDAVGVDVDFSSLPGGVGALRLMVTDGFHTAIADSEMFRVPAKGVLLGIQAPVAGERIRSGEAVWFRGQAFDVDQRRAAGGTFVWQSSRDGFLGSGGAIRNTLSAGTHEISLSMADRTEARPVRINVDVGGEQTET